MSAASIRWAMEQGRRHALPAPERLLLVMLADRADSDGSCCPGQDALAEDTGLVERHIRRLTGKLVKRGLIRLERRGRALHYHIVRVNGMDPEPKHRTQSPVSEPVIPAPESGIAETPAPESGIEEPTPAPESGIPGGYRKPVPVFGPENAETPAEQHRKLVPAIPDTESAIDPPIPDTESGVPSRARVPAYAHTLPFLEKKEEEITDSGEEREGGLGGERTISEPVAPKRGKPAHQLPDSWAPNAFSVSLGTELGFSVEQIRQEADAMRDWALDKRKTGHEWDRRFNNWLRKEAKDRYIRGIRNAPRPGAKNAFHDLAKRMDDEMSPAEWLDFTRSRLH